MNAISKPGPASDTGFQAAPIPDDPELLKAYFERVQSYQANEVQSAHRGKRVAWGVAIAAFLIAGIACSAVIVLETRKPQAPPPIVLRVNDTTGMVDRVYDVQGGEMAATEAERRYWLWQYVRHRQGYVFGEAQQNYDIVSLMSTPEVQQQYDAWFKGSSPQSPQVQLGRNGQATVSWVSTQFNPDHPKLAVVRFVQQERKGDQLLPRRNMIATIGFDFAKGPLSGSAINVNPRGFLVTSYHADQESTP